MSSVGSEKDGVIADLLTRARQAFDRGDKHSCGVMINSILKIDFTNFGAWELLYSLFGEDKPFLIFQREFAQKYYPNKSYLLAPSSSPELEDNNEMQQNSSYPVSQISGQIMKDDQSIASFCPRCGRENAEHMPFCRSCGYQFSSIPVSPLPQPLNQVHSSNQSDDQRTNFQTTDRSQQRLLFSSIQNSSAGHVPPGIPPLPQFASRPDHSNARGDSGLTQQKTRTNPNHITPARLVAVGGFIMMILAGLVQWRRTVEIAWFTARVDANIGLSVKEGIICVICGIFGLILMLSIKKQIFANIWAILLIIIASISSISFIMNYSYGVAADYIYMGVGPYVVLVGAVVVLGAPFIPSPKIEDTFDQE